MFNAISVSLMCEACKKKGALECPHNQHEIPHWKRDKKRGKLVQSIMSTDKTMYLRENAGVVAKKENNAFSLDGVDILSSSTFEFHSAIDIKAPMFTCIDTAGGGSSCTAVCTGIFTPSHSLVVIAADSAIVNTDAELEEFLKGHFDQIRGNAIFAEIDIVAIIEQNYGGWVGASRVAAICSQFSPISFFSGDTTGKNRVGVVTSQDTKESMRFSLQQLLRSEKVKFYDNFYSMNIDTKEGICSQLKAYRYVDKGNEDDVMPRRRGLTGKGAGKNDDLSIALQLLSFWPSFYWDNPKRARSTPFG